MRYIFVLSLLVISLKSFSQFGYGKVEDIQDIKKRTLIILLEEEDGKILKKLAKKPDELKFYKEEIVRLNADLTENSYQILDVHICPDYKDADRG